MGAIERKEKGIEMQTHQINSGKGGYNMKKTKFRVGILLLVMIAFILILFSPALAQTPATKATKKLIAVTTYDVGASTYISAAAIADYLMKTTGIKTRVIPFGNDISRTLPLRTRSADFSFAGVGTYYFAEEGLHDFASADWGPQRVMAVWNTFPVGGSSMVTAKDAGIKTPYDVKGKRMFWIPGTPAMNVTNTAFLAFANLTWNDVVKVTYPSFGAAARGMIEGTCDAGFNTATNSTLYELEKSRRGIWWPEYSPKDKEGWKRLQSIAPYMRPFKNYGGAGQPPEGVQTMTYSYPLVACYDWQDEALVYLFTKALDQGYNEYKDAYPMLKNFSRDMGIVNGLTLPYHKGAIRYFKEIGVWNAEFEAWQKNRLEKQDALAVAWAAAVEEASNKKVKSKDFSDFWMKKHDEVIKKYGTFLK
jgi:TRAP transporter TAXI family solute receptor